MLRNVTSVLIVASVVAATAGCSDPDRQVNRSAASTTTVQAQANSINPYDALLEARRLALITEAKVKAHADRCMQVKGHPMPVAHQPERDSNTFNESQARTEGYGRWIGSDDTSELSEGALAAYLGPESRHIVIDVARSKLRVRTGGCLGEAREKVYGDLSTWVIGSELSDNLPSYSGYSPASSAKWSDLNARWANCMKVASKIAATSPEELISRAQRERGQLPRPTTRELRNAIADAQCRERIDFAHQRADMIAEFERTSSARFQAEILAYRSLLLRANRDS